MSAGLIFLAAQLAFVGFGSPAAFLPVVRGFGLPARMAAAFLAGSVAVTLELTFFSLLSIPCTVTSLSLPLLMLATILSMLMIRLPHEEDEGTDPSAPTRLPVLWLVLILLASLHLGWAVVSARATSMDYLFTWGVRGAHYAADQGIRPDFLKAPFNIHMHTNYPPLLPATLAWSALVAGRTSWLGGLACSMLWYLATLALLQPLLARRLGAQDAFRITALWSITMSLTLVSTMSGGSAEPPLLAFETIAITVLLTNPTRNAGLAVLTAVCLAGALLTKIEGLLGVVLIVAAALAADLMLQRRPREQEIVCYVVLPFACWGLWPVFENVYGVNTSDAMRAYETLDAFSFQYLPQILHVSLVELAGPAFGIPVLLALATIVIHRRRWLTILPVLFFCVGSLAVYEGYYFIHGSDPTTWIRWTFGRITQPLVSALIVAAGVLAFDPLGPIDSERAVENDPIGAQVGSRHVTG